MNIEDSVEWERYGELNARSKHHANKVRSIIPSRTSRSLLRHPPFPFFVERASGVSSTDIDGNERIDFHNNYTTLIHGHGHPEIMKAIEQQLPKGTSYSAPVVLEERLASLLCERVKSVEQVVFNNSGTEAVMLALRIARAVNGRKLIGKFEGGYHGASDFVMVGGHDLPSLDDPARVTKPTAGVAGLPPGATEEVVLMRYNDAQAVREAVASYGKDLAAIIVEPIQGAGGVIPADDEFLKVLREETAKAGIVLIFDEVISLRHAVGGAQGYYGLEPDLTTMAKTIGGGFPIGAVGGKREFMRVLEDPSEGGTVANLGTFSANPMSVTAGAVSMELLDEAAIAHINALGDSARSGLAGILTKHDLPAQVCGAGSLLQVHWTNAPLLDARGPATADANLNLLTFLGLCNRGVQLSMRGIVALSTPMRQSHIDTLLTAFEETVVSLKSQGYCQGYC